MTTSQLLPRDHLAVSVCAIAALVYVVNTVRPFPLER